MADIAPITEFYGRWARLYDLVARRTPGIAALRAQTADALALSPGDTVVEMGCGTGANLPYLRERVGARGRVVGIDLTPGVLAHARGRIEREGWENVHLVNGNAAAPPVRSADAVLATFVVGMLDDPAAAVGRWCDLMEGDRLALLDSTPSDRPLVRPANALFRAFVTVTSPPGTKIRYTEPPTAVLERRVEAARAVLSDRGPIAVDERRLLGFVRLTAGSV